MQILEITAGVPSILLEVQMQETFQLSARTIQLALLGNPECDTGVVVRRVHVDGRGVFAGPEALCTIYAQGPTEGYWYGHVRPYGAFYSAALIRLNNLVSASSDRHLIARFGERMDDPRNYVAVSSAEPGSAIAISRTFKSACSALARMVANFDKAEFLVRTEQQQAVLRAIYSFYGPAGCDLETPYAADYLGVA
jgi:hypothetical protein